MVGIGGNITGTLQKKAGTVTNEIGELVPTWTNVTILKGFLDYSSGEANRNTYDAKIQDTTHIFICDYVPISETAEECRMVINNKIYDVLAIDDPMELKQHLEIMLKYTGR